MNEPAGEARDPPSPAPSSVQRHSPSSHRTLLPSFLTVCDQPRPIKPPPRTTTTNKQISSVRFLLLRFLTSPNWLLSISFSSHSSVRPHPKKKFSSSTPSACLALSPFPSLTFPPASAVLVVPKGDVRQCLAAWGSSLYLGNRVDRGNHNTNE